MIMRAVSVTGESLRLHRNGDTLRFADTIGQKRNCITAKLIDSSFNSARPADATDTVGLSEYLQLMLEDRQKTVAGQYAICDFRDRKSTRLNSSHVSISYAVF